MKSLKISIKEAAEQLNVSVVSIHNWIKEGSLQKTDNILTQKNINDFRDNFLKSSKLSSRANKQYKDMHNHDSLSKDIRKDLDSTMSGEEVSDKYESLLSESHKNKEGVYYTPRYIVEDMMKDVVDVEDKTFLDPCCGSGNFIIEAIKKGISPENVYGFDVDENAVEITKKRIKEISGYESDNIICADFLSKKTKTKSQKFDYIFTNPPWGKKISKADRFRYSSLYNSGNSSDTSSLFCFASMKMLKDNGTIGFLLPDSFFNITTFEDARKSLLTLKINRLVDYGKAFKGLMTKAVAFVATKANSQQLTANSQQPIVTSTPLFINEKYPQLEWFKDMMKENAYVFQQADLHDDIAKANLRLSQSNYYPVISLYGKQTIASYQVPKNLVPNTIGGMNLVWDIFDGLARERNIQLTKIESEIVAETQLSLKNDLEVAVDEWHANLKQACINAEELQSSLELAQEVYRIRKKSFSEGLCTSQQVLDALNLVNKTNLLLLTTYFEYDIALANLCCLCGIPEYFESFLTSQLDF